MSRKERHSSNHYPSLMDELVNDWHQQLISRRKFILATAATVAAGFFPLGALSASSKSANETGKFSEDSRQTLSAVQNHLFPTSSDSPGAKEINAMAYLLGVLESSYLDDGEKIFILNGVGWLEDLSHSTFNKKFVALKEPQREQLLSTVAKSRAGENWISTILLYIFEALLSDPVYGGNPGGTGWKWLQHQPGFPRPPADKVYSKLGYGDIGRIR